ncbi:keratin-like protein KRT222-like, partial [Scleropages formosus]
QRRLCSTRSAGRGDVLLGLAERCRHHGAEVQLSQPVGRIRTEHGEPCASGHRTANRSGSTRTQVSVMVADHKPLPLVHIPSHQATPSARASPTRPVRRPRPALPVLSCPVLAPPPSGTADVCTEDFYERPAFDQFAEFLDGMSCAYARRQWHSLQVEMESLQALEKGLESSLRSTQKQYKVQLEDLSVVIRRLESELGQVRSDIESQRQLHLQLLNTKVRLEQEITTYRQLLECEEGRKRATDETRTFVCENPVVRTEPERRAEKNSAPAKTQQVLRGTVMRESAEAHGTVESKKIDVVIKQWEGSFFKGNPKLRKKSVSLRFDLHMAAADDGCAQTQQDDLPDVEVRLVMKRSRSIPSMTQ